METKHWDVIIVGGGMAGLLTAYFLQKGSFWTILPGMTCEDLK